jgi:hypothetical protein
MEHEESSGVGHSVHIMNHLYAAATFHLPTRHAQRMALVQLLTTWAMDTTLPVRMRVPVRLLAFVPVYATTLKLRPRKQWAP